MRQDNHLQTKQDKERSSPYFTNQGCILSTEDADEPF